MATDTVTCLAADYTFVTSNRPAAAQKSVAKKNMWLKSGAGTTGNPTAYPIVIPALPRDFTSRYTLSAIYETTLTTVPSAAPTLQRIAQPNGHALTGTTYNNRPGTAAGSSAVAGSLKAGTTSTYQFDVTAEMRLVAANGLGTWWGFQVTTTDTTMRNVAGPQATTGVPVLTLVLTDDTPAPDGLGPAGVTALAKPVVSWTSPNDIDQVRLQIDVVGGSFTSPVADTGVLAATPGVTAQDINTATTTWTTTAWAGLTSGGTGVDVRVWHHGPRGGIWSDPITISRVNYPALTITNPANGGTTNDPTPENDWTFANQRQFWVWVTNAAGAVVFDSRVTPGADQSWTPVLTGPTYLGRLVDMSTMTTHVRVWDTQAGRVASAGDLGYVEATSTWTIAPDAATTAPTGVAAAQLTATPAVRLTWSRASGAPDQWVIVRDGQVVAQIDGSVGQSGTNWTYDDWTATPYNSHVYSVAAKVGAKASTRVAATAVVTQVGGVWLYHPGTGAYFSLADATAMDGVGLTESSIIYRPIYGQVPIKRTMALGGYAGPVQGDLDTWDNRSIAVLQADLHTIRVNSATDTCRYIAADMNIPVIVSALSDPPSSDWLSTRTVRRVSYRVDQCGEFPDALPVGG